MTAAVATDSDSPPHAGLDAALIVEAALFSAGKPLLVGDIADTTGITRRKVMAALDVLSRRYQEADSALEIGRAGEKWSMQVKSAYAPATTRLAPMEIPLKLLKTLALIAYHQPVLQSDLKEMVGAKAYDHIKELKEVGLVKKRAHERSYLVVTTERFPDYFGIPAADREGIRHYLAEKVGLELPKQDNKGNKKLAAFPASPPSAGAAASSEAAPAEQPPDDAARAEERPRADASDATDDDAPDSL